MHHVASMSAHYQQLLFPPGLVLTVLPQMTDSYNYMSSSIQVTAQKHHDGSTFISLNLEEAIFKLQNITLYSKL